MSRSGDTLDSPERRHPHLHRPPRRGPRQSRQQLPGGVAQRGALRFLAGVERRQNGLDRGGLTVRRGHAGTIRPRADKIRNRPWVARDRCDKA
ncbi:hypothetical protein Sya03_21210 [Spirilliplanes yamanashiensis]|uniref:Uncharacterized protein n=1 Tax=Spirilliplanes yamanashiensis TaxID=42233 RepID=A0A8J3Y7G2_9ACTN|nr:hypothetical protein Sya03_21210 [Spirilliplanes yamanashiensis]